MRAYQRVARVRVCVYVFVCKYGITVGAWFGPRDRAYGHQLPDLTARSGVGAGVSAPGTLTS